MSGDVFGNGMLLSRHIKLLAAFNHAHVFLDPDPDPETSFAERKRLFELPRSSWSDYDPSLTSEGGGVYPRTAKSIRISQQVKEALAIDADELPPNELIREILRAPVDLLWNGGIGTYVKASSETHADVGDKANDAVRLDARHLAVGLLAREATWGSRSAAGSSTRSRAAASTPTRSTTWPGSTAQTTRSTSRSCSIRLSPPAISPTSNATSYWSQ